MAEEFSFYLKITKEEKKKKTKQREPSQFQTVYARTGPRNIYILKGDFVSAASLAELSRFPLPISFGCSPGLATV